MLRWLLACGLALLASTASAQPVIDLYWQDCGGPTDESFACDSNTGSRHNLVATVRSPFDIPDFVGATIVLELVSDGVTLPAWWDFSVGGCRQGSFLSTDPPTAGLSGCYDPYPCCSVIGYVAPSYQPNWNGDPRRARVTYDGLSPDPLSIPAGAEAIAGLLQITNRKSTGVDACDGCTRPVCIVIQEITFYTASGGTFVLRNPPGVQNAQYVTWQGGVTGPGDDCPAATPAPNRTWGEVKALYR